MNSKKNIAIIFAKRESVDFDRYTFPLFGRPAFYYPVLAAKHTSNIDKVYISTDSHNLLRIGSRIPEVHLLVRKEPKDTLTEEIQEALKRVSNDLGEEPQIVAILFANSPCVTNDLLYNAISFLEENKEYDSVVSAMRRGEFSPARMFKINENDLIQNKGQLNNSDNVYFLDHRIMVIRSEQIKECKVKSDFIESILGRKIHSIIQKEGVWDIDYHWQIPMIEKWLRLNGFTDQITPYGDSLNKMPVKFSDKEQRETDTKYKVLITTVPFGENDKLPLQLLESNDQLEYLINPLNRKLKENELLEILPDYDIVIAGTEPITRKVLNASQKLKLISRVGIGLDSVDLIAARESNIAVAYTPEAPSPAVSELTISHILNLLRHVPLVDRKLRAGVWQRISGERLANSTIGIIGTGRIGKRVIKHLQGFHPKQILANDLFPDLPFYSLYGVKSTDKETIYRESDIITLHVPLTRETINLISFKELKSMKPSTYIVNTSRGKIIDENALYFYLKERAIGGAALDVFENEPYSGNLVELENCYLSCHMGSMTKDCRATMEIQATEEVIRFVNGEKLMNKVPEQEYEIQIK